MCLCAFEEKEDEETEVVVHREEREKMVQTEINKIIYTHATVTVHIGEKMVRIEINKIIYIYMLQ